MADASFAILFIIGLRRAGIENWVKCAILGVHVSLCLGLCTTENPGGGTLGIFGWGCAAGTLEPLTYTRASSAEFCYPLLE